MARRGVFKIVNKRTGKVYVGSSNTNLDRLIDSYWNKLYSGTHHNNELQSDFDYYGSSSFEYVIVSDSCYSEDEVRSVRESEIYLNRFNTYNEDVPVHYDGGNPNASFGKSNRSNINNRDNAFQKLFDILDKSNLPRSTKNDIKVKIRIGTISTKAQLQKEINDTKKVSKFSDSKIKELADEYCSLTEFTDWKRRGNEIVFERRKSLFNSERVYKSILIYDIGNHISNIKNSFLSSKKYDTQSNKPVNKIAEFICEVLGFDSYEVSGTNCILFDKKYRLCGVKLEKMYKLFNESINCKLDADNLEINKKLERTVKTDNFNKKLKDLIFDYIDKRNIQYWDMLINGNIILFDKYLHIVNEQHIIKDLDSDYAKLNQKFSSSLLGSVFRIFSNKPAEPNPKNELLTVLVRSATPIKAKLEIKNKISYGKIKTKDELKTAIKNSRPKEKAKRRWVKNFKRCRNCGRLVKNYHYVCGSCNYDFKRRKVIPKDDDFNSQEIIKTISNPNLINCPNCGRAIKKNAVRCKYCNYYFKRGKEFPKANIKTSKNNLSKKDLIECPHCKELNEKNAVRCKLCHYDFELNEVTSKTNKNNSKNKSKVKSKHNELIKCPNCGELIKKNAVRCKYCNYYFKQGKVMPKTKTKNSNVKNNSNQTTKKKLKAKTNQKDVDKKDLIKCPNCGELINKSSHFCVNCDCHLKDGKVNTKRNVKFCCECHEDVNIGATACSKCGSKSFVYNKNVTKLLSFSIKHDRHSIGEKKWRYIQNTDDNEEYIIYAESKIELKRKVLANHLPWEDKKIESNRSSNKDNSNSKKGSKGRGGYYSYDYDYDETPSHQYYERDNFTSQEVLGDDYYYINR